MLIINIIFVLLFPAELLTIGQGQETGESQTLLPIRKIERTLKGGETQSYEVTLEAGHYLHMDVEQHGIDVVLQLISPDGKTIVERDRPNNTRGQESLSFIAPARGEYRLAVKSPSEKVGPGKYEIESQTLRTPTAQDKKRVEAEKLFQEALQQALAARTESALAQVCTKLEAVATLWRDVGDKYAEALALTSLGQGREYLNENEKAIAAHQRAFSLYRELGNRPDEALSLKRLSLLNALTQRLEPALYQYRNARAIYRDLKDLDGEKDLHAQFSEVAGGNLQAGVKLSQLRTAKALRNSVKFLATAREMYRELEDGRNEARALLSLGRVSKDLGDVPKALDYYGQALPLANAAGNKPGVAWTLNNIGAAHYALGDTDKALDYYNRALFLFREIKDRLGEATTLSNIGSVYYSLGDTERALDYFERQALPLSADDKPGKATTLNNIGLVYYSLGEMERALDHFENQALPLYREIKDKQGEATTLSNIGLLFYSLGETKKALGYFENQALPLYGEAGDKSGEATTFNNIGGAYSALGDKQKALDYYEKRALPLYIEVGDKSGEAATLSNIGLAYHALEEMDKALDYYNRSLSLFREIKNKPGEATTLNNIGGVYSALGDKRKAIDDYEKQALVLFREVANKYGEATSLSNMMGYWDDLKNPRLAVFYGKQAVNVFQRLRRTNQGLDKGVQRSFLKSVEESYRQLVHLLIEQGRLAEAHQALNAFKDQQYFDFDRETLKKPSPLRFTEREADLNSLYAVTSDKVSVIKRQVEDLKLTIGNRNPNREELSKLRQLESDLKVATNKYLAVFKQAETEFSQPTDVVRDRPPSIDDTRDMQTALRALGKKTVAIYTLSGTGDFRALVVTHRDLIAVSSPMLGVELNYKAKQLWALLQSDEYDPKVLSKEIYDVVFKPIKDRLLEEKKLEEVLPEGATITWSLDANLRYLPVGALYDGEKYLVERYNNVVFTRADSERWTRPVSRPWTGVGFGSSRGGPVQHLDLVYPFDYLPYVSEELNAVFKTNNSRSGVFIGTIFPDSKFNREAMIVALKQRRPLAHIASHFWFSPGDEARSFLLLGDGTVFPLNEMKRHTDLFQGVELLTLSACETAAQWADSDGREVDGFAELAQRQGAASVLATLWKVRDDSSYWLLRDFYREKRDLPKQTKAESLRRAQIALLDGTAVVTPLNRAKDINAKRRSGTSTVIKILTEGEVFPRRSEDGVVYVEARYARPYNRNDARLYAHPYFWSPFVLFGNWR